MCKAQNSTDSSVANYQDVTCADPSTVEPSHPGDLIKTISSVNK